jgi:hypothetical protein
MDGLTIAEIALSLGIAPDAAKKRLQKAGVKPKAYVGPVGVYDPSAIDAIKYSPSPGRPKKEKK